MRREGESQVNINDIYKKRVSFARVSLISFSLLTAVNYILALFKSDFAFVFSAFIPEYLLSFAEYAGDVLNSRVHYYVFVFISAFFVVSILACSFLSLRNTSFLFPSLVILGCDSFFMALHFIANFDLLASTNFIGMLLHAAFHIICTVYVIFGAIAEVHLQKAKKEASAQKPKPE